MLPNDDAVDVPFYLENFLLSSTRAIFDTQSILSYHMCTASPLVHCTEYHIARRDIVACSHRSIITLVWWWWQPPSCICQCGVWKIPHLPLWRHHCVWISAKVREGRFRFCTIRSNPYRLHTMVGKKDKHIPCPLDIAIGIHSARVCKLCHLLDM